MSLVSFQSSEPFHAYEVQLVPFEQDSLSLRLPLRPHGFPLALVCLFSWAVATFSYAPFLTGDLIYNKTDGAGCQFYAICNQHCDVDRFQGTCPSSSPPVPSTPAPSPPLPPGCDNVIPPRQVSFPYPSSFLQSGMGLGCQGQLLWG